MPTYIEFPRWWQETGSSSNFGTDENSNVVQTTQFGKWLLGTSSRMEMTILQNFLHVSVVRLHKWPSYCYFRVEDAILNLCPQNACRDVSH